MSLSGVDLPVAPQHCAEQQFCCFEILVRLSLLSFPSAGSSEELEALVIGEIYFPFREWELLFA